MILGLSALVAFTGCQRLVDLTVGAFIDCDEHYLENPKHDACYTGVNYANEDAAIFDLSGDKNAIRQRVANASSRAKYKCENIYGFFDARRGACKDGVNFFKRRAENALL